MKSTISGFLLAAVFAAMSLAACRADVMVVESTVINAPGIRAMLDQIPESQRAMLGKALSPMVMGQPWVTTTYMQGSRMRTDMGETSVIINTSSGHSATINRQTQTYAIGAYDPVQKTAGQIACRIEPAGKTSMILGHKVDGYSVTLTLSVLPNCPVTGVIWAAPDLPTPPPSGFTGPVSAGFEAQMAKVKGLPLSYQIDFKNTPAGDISIESNAVSISDAPLTAAVFDIPSGYHQGKVQTATAMPSAGMPLGDGMPLDTIGGVSGDVASGGGDAGGLGAVSASSLQQLLGSLGGSGGTQISPQQLNQALGMLGQSGGSNSGGSPVNLQQLSTMLNSLLNGDE